MILNYLIRVVNFGYLLPKRINGLSCSLSTKKINSDLLSDRYTFNEQERVLDVLNSFSDCAPTMVKIGNKQFETIKNYLNKNGKFKDINEILNVNGIGPVFYQKLCDRILNKVNSSSEGNSQRMLKTNSNLVTPVISDTEKRQIKSIVGLEVGNFYLSWSRLDYENKIITDWGLINFLNAMDPKNLISMYEFVISLRKAIPSSDIYVIENTNWSVMSSQTSLLNHVRAAQTTAMVLPFLNGYGHDCSSSSDNDETLPANSNRVYFLKTYLPTRYFKTLIGSERVSPQKMVEDMFNGSFPDYCSTFNVEQDLKDYYFKNDKTLRESLCQSLLLVITFMDVVLLNKVDFLKRNSVKSSRGK